MPIQEFPDRPSRSNPGLPALTLVVSLNSALADGVSNNYRPVDPDRISSPIP